MKTSLNSVERHYSSRFRASQMVAAIFGTGALFGSALLTAHILNVEAENYVGDALKHGLDDISHRVAMAVENDFMKHDIRDNLGDLESWADRRGPNYVGSGERWIRSSWSTLTALTSRISHRTQKHPPT